MNNESQILNVPIEDIIPNRFQPRLNFDDAALNELAESIKEHGIIQPLVLRRLNDKYEIIAGERRYKAAKLAGLTGVPAIISNLDDKKSAEVSIVENVQRKDLSAIEEAKSYKALLDKGYLTQEELARKMGLSQSAISNKLRLLTLSEKVQDALMENKISERHARSLLQLKSVDKQNEWLEKVIKDRLTVRELDMKIKEENNIETEKTLEPKEQLSEEPEETKSTIEETKDPDDVPIIELTPNLDAIRANATDIVKEEPKAIIEERIIEEKPIPNKFFNYLEDEEANMSLIEPQSPDKEDGIELLDFDFATPTTIPEANTEINEEKQVENEKIQIPTEAEVNIEENFEIPNIEEPKIEESPIIEEPKEVDLTKANNLVDELMNNLNNEYKVNLEKEETDNNIKYTIIIDK